MSLALLSRLFDWRDALVVVRPETLLRWRRAGWRLFWRCKSRPGRPRIPLELRQFIRRMATENPLWGEERIANELLLKLGLRVSPRTIRKYMPKRPPGRPRGDQRWSTFLHNHAQGIVACDFFVSVTATFRLFYVLVLIEHGSRRLLHVNVTQHPSAELDVAATARSIWDTAIYRYLIHDRDRMFARNLDDSIKKLGMTVLKSPPHSPKANAVCERVIGTIRRECLDWLIPLSESHLRSILKSWLGHYNARPPTHGARPGRSGPSTSGRAACDELSRHRIGEHVSRARPIGAGRPTSRIFACACIGLIEYLRRTGRRPASEWRLRRLPATLLLTPKEIGGWPGARQGSPLRHHEFDIGPGDRCSTWAAGRCRRLSRRTLPIARCAIIVSGLIRDTDPRPAFCRVRRAGDAFRIRHSILSTVSKCSSTSPILRRLAAS